MRAGSSGQAGAGGGSLAALSPPAGPPPPPGREALLRLITALIADQLGRLRGRAVPVADWQAWGPDTGVDEAEMGVDSLARLDLVARLNSFFHLAETGVEDYLLIHTRLGEWADLVAESLTRWHDRLTFESSGSTGTPTRHGHRTAGLAAEVAGHLALLGPPARVVALVPPHHIYGYLFTVLLPRLAGCPVLDARALSPARIPGLTRTGDLVIATPFLWEHVLAGQGRFADGVTGVSSGAPAPDSLWPALAGAGLSRLVEVYGSSETAGIGWRDRDGAAFTLLPHLVATPAGLCHRDGPPLPVPPDHLVTEAGDRFRPAGRRDGAVQVGGVNVWPARVRDHLLGHPGVAGAAVRPDPATGRLKAFIVPVPGGGIAGAAGAAALDRFARLGLTPPECPARYRFGAALPVSAMGKPADWPDADARAEAAAQGLAGPPGLPDVMLPDVMLPEAVPSGIVPPDVVPQDMAGSGITRSA